MMDSQLLVKEWCYWAQVRCVVEKQSDGIEL